VKQIARQYTPGLYRSRLTRAFLFNTRPWLSIFMRRPIGWGQGSRKRLQRVIADANRYVQTLNDRFTDPSGKVVAAKDVPVASLLAVEPAADTAAHDSLDRRGSAQG
jgi:hypothetical protein